MDFTFTALLCVGLTLGFRTPVLAAAHFHTGSLPKPILRVQPDSVVSEQTTVTFLCKGTMGAEEYRLYKEVYQRLQFTEIPQNPKNQAEFSISKVHRQHAGRYCCRYWTYYEWSEYSDSVELVVSGVYSKPSLSALPSPVVTEGGNAILQCASNQQYHRLLLTNKGSQKQFFTKDSQYNYSTRQFQAQFSVGPVTSSQRWTFMCYSYHSYSPQVWSEPSETLELLVSGTLHKPTIKAEPGSIVASGILMTIWCQGNLDAEIYVVHKEGSQKPLEMQNPEKSENKIKFSIPSVTRLHAGQYHCYCYSSAGWTERSDTLELVVTGIHNSKPRLSALPSHLLTLGENMTFQCISKERYDKFILTKEDQKFLSSVDSQYIHSKMQYQALLSTDHVTIDHKGRFKCYGYYKQIPQLWSVPSDTLEIHISGLERYLQALIGVSVAFLLFLFILVFLLLRRKRQGKFGKETRKETELQLPAGTAAPTTRDRGSQKRSNPAAATQEESLYASVEDMKPKDGVEMDSSRPLEEDPPGETYAQVKPRREEAVLPSVLSREVLETKDGNKTEEGREMDTQAADSEEPQDVVYAQLCSRSLRQGTAVPPRSQAGEATEESSVYAALAVTRPGSVPDNKEQ